MSKIKGADGSFHSRTGSRRSLDDARSPFKSQSSCVRSWNDKTRLRLIICVCFFVLVAYQILDTVAGCNNFVEHYLLLEDNARRSSIDGNYVSDYSSLPAESSNSIMKKAHHIYWQTKDNHDWPGIPQEQLGSPLVQKGYVEFIANARSLLLKDLREFLEIYKNRPDKVNLCGMRINHSYSLWLAIKHLKPTAIIENGVNAGHSTYIMRAAAPHARIYAIDPLEQPICGQKERWMDTGDSEYYTGKTFHDFADIDWGSKINSGELDPSTTLVLLDDHLDPSLRYPTILKHGFKHLLFEDNYKVGKGATPGDRAGWLPKQLFHSTSRDAEFFWQITKRYAEFPPLVPSMLASKSDVPAKKAGGFLHITDDLNTLVPPLLRPDRSTEDKRIYEEEICRPLGINADLRDNDSYMQVMNYNQFAYMELLPMAPRLIQMWDARVK